MNIQPGNSVRRRPVKTEKNTSNGVSEICSLIALVLRTAMIIGMFGTFCYAYVTLGNRITTAAGEAKHIKEQIAREKRETIGLKGIEAQRSSRDYVMAQVRRFNLPLTPARYHQTRRLTVLTAEQAAQTQLQRPRHETAARTGYNYRVRP
ncbi:MAG: hypothetical protein IJW35_05125 [Lentisphaeria bacterium]|nr:hypothetical protein [Lentisphaeria bacterium]